MNSAFSWISKKKYNSKIENMPDNTACFNRKQHTGNAIKIPKTFEVIFQQHN